MAVVIHNFNLFRTDTFAKQIINLFTDVTARCVANLIQLTIDMGKTDAIAERNAALAEEI